MQIIKLHERSYKEEVKKRQEKKAPVVSGKDEK